ncbi:MADS-box transcription factor 14-like [Impatiens glandulifera]|uniref:MADS-box transcription factor 14-like n=1 Tax=Impatiens glandulifera TaxID=253017 RepID=UPI001FB0D587|nr:MADS-box transcription factor 14-like [Impatiens glandulifera]
MGRAKFQLKRIEEAHKRNVSFSKRRYGLMKKAGELSVLCEAEVAIVIFTRRGRLYRSASGDEMNRIIERYQTFVNSSIQQNNGQSKSNVAAPSEQINIQHLVQRFFHQLALEQLDVSAAVELEQLLHAKLVQTRARKAQLLMESLAAIHEKEKKMWEEKLQNNLRSKHQVMLENVENSQQNM